MRRMSTVRTFMRMPAPNAAGFSKEERIFMSPVRLNVPAKWIRLVCLGVFFAVVLFSLPAHPKHNGANAESSWPRRTQGPPSHNLPNLDDVRGIEPRTPKMMPPVPATKCRGRDEKCKKAKEKISNNLPDNHGRLLAYAGHRSMRDYADWLNTGIPALAILADLIYWPARMISDSPDIPYRSHGDLLAESVVKGANPRSETFGNTVLKGSRKEYGYRVGRSLVTAQSGGIVSVSPSAYQTPYSGPAGPIGTAVTSPSNPGHGSTTSFASNLGHKEKSCRWSGFQAVSGQIVSITLKVDWSENGSLGDGDNSFVLEYSLDNGSSWNILFNHIEINAPNFGTAQVSLPSGQDISLVQVRDVLTAHAPHVGSTSVTGSVSSIRLEVEAWNCFASVPGNRWKGEYYNNTNLSGSPVMVRDDSTPGTDFLNVNFGGGSPHSICAPAADNFSARWTRTVNLAQGIYRFSAAVDDRVQLYVDGYLRLDQEAPGAYTADVFLSAGDHEIKVEFIEYTGLASISLSWTAVSGANCYASVPADRWKGEYYSNTNLSGSQAMVRDDGAGFLNMDFGGASPSATCGLGVDYFSARWTRTVNFTATGLYRFTATVDNGVRLRVDDQVKIDQWGDLPPNTYEAEVFLTEGAHQIKLEFVEYVGSARASLSWAALTPGDLSMALIDPINRIGSPGEDLLSRNCNWSLPLLALPGRAGLDLGLALSLNSLVYTRAGSAIHFDPDQGYPAPGFRLGFPEIRNAFTNTEAGTQSYLLSMPSGSRVEFRQINANVYEAVDSSYMLLTHDTVNSVFILYTTDGTQLRFEDVTSQGDYKCKQIKDRHGNFITIGYGGMAEISTITDTLGRIVNFYYDGFNHLNSITQNWGGQTHTWATFAYGTQTVQTNFPGLTLNGTANGAQESVLLRVGLADGSVYSFEYNTYAQVKTIRRYAPNNSNPVNFPGDYFQRAYTTYGLPDNATNPQTDCPRITSRTDWASDWNDGVTSTYEPGSGYAWGQVTFPDNTIYKEFFATTGWQRGLTTQTENWASGVRKKWTTLQWTQDNTGVAYRLNPRVTETNVYDEAGNRRRTTVSHTSFGLPSDVYEYDVNATTVLRRMHTDYNLSAVYTNRRIIGLPSAQFLYDGGDNLFSKVDYQYDLGGGYQVHQGPPVQHDTNNYGSGFVQGRGNLNVVRRSDVTDPDETSKASEYETGYNTSGSVVFTRDPLDHQTSVSYIDSFSDGQNDRNTYAYPTTMTDPDQFSSTVQYNYYFGAVTQTK
jgi:YD repeat-containing protein